MGLDYRVVTNMQQCLVVLDGDITAGCGTVVAEIRASLTHNKVVFSLSGVRSINSIGCHEWSREIRVIADLFTLTFVDCPIPFVDYCNLYPAMAGQTRTAKITSFFTPYHCKNCDADVTSLVELNEVQTTVQLPRRVCDKCQAGMIPEIESEDYLAFVQRLSPGT